MNQRFQQYSVRLATSDDAGAIAEIYNQGIATRLTTFETEPRTAQEIQESLRARGAQYPTVVVCVENRVLAWAGASPYRARTCYRGVAEFSVYVHRDARGAGLGHHVLAALMHECERRGLWKLVSRIFPENVASRRLCATLGFREVGVYRRHARLDGAWRDTVIVEKLLGEARGA
ncbi:MAG: GNAT family N-acetyltransferase [Luteitalea sp.]|nr:GNAT family N-acetyltransferase [Luteitalea sp.]